MKVLFFTTAYDPRMEVQVVHQEFLHRLQERGCEVAILTSQGGSSRGELFQREDLAGIPLYRYALRGRPSDELLNLFSRRVFHYDGFLSILRRYREYPQHFPLPEVVHIESAYPLGGVAALARRAVAVPYVITVRGADLFNEPGARFGYARFRLVRRLLRSAFRHAAITRATTPQTRDIILSYGAVPRRVRLVPRNIRDDCFPADLPAFRVSARAEVIGQHGIPQVDRILVAAGRMLPIKGFDHLLRAFSQVLDLAPDTTLLLCGPTRHDPVVGDYRTYLEGLAGELGVRQRVVFTGELPAARFTRYLAAADLTVVSSIREGSNKVLLEAAALGTPFVATETSGTGAFFRDPPGGIEVPPGDAPALAAAMVELLRDDERRRTLGRQAAQACARFRSDRVADGMMLVYEEALKGRAQ